MNLRELLDSFINLPEDAPLDMEVVIQDADRNIGLITNVGIWDVSEWDNAEVPLKDMLPENYEPKKVILITLE